MFGKKTNPELDALRVSSAREIEILMDVISNLRKEKEELLSMLKTTQIKDASDFLASVREVQEIEMEAAVEPEEEEVTKKKNSLLEKFRRLHGTEYLKPLISDNV